MKKTYLDGLDAILAKGNEHQVIRLFPSLASQARPFHEKLTAKT